MTWIDIINGELMSSVRSKINTFNESAKLKINKNTSDISNIDSDVAGLHTEVLTQSGHISTLSTGVNSLQADTTLNTTKIDILGAISYNTELSGFNLHQDFKPTLGTIEYCLLASSQEYYKIDHNQVKTKITGATTFGDGSTPLADRTFAIRNSDGESEYSYFNRSTPTSKVGILTIQHSNTYDRFFIVFDINGDLKVTTDVEEAIMSSVMIATIRIDPDDNKKLVFGNERHGFSLDSTLHKTLYHTSGPRWAYGLDVSGIADNGDTFLGISEGTFFDSDIEHKVPAASTSKFMWRENTGVNWKISDNDDNKLGMMNGSSQVVYNKLTGSTWSLEPIGTGYIIMHLFVNSDVDYQFIKVLGQKIHTNRAEARKHIFQEIGSVTEKDLPVDEMFHVGSYIIHTENKGEIEPGLEGEVWLDCRKGHPIARH